MSAMPNKEQPESPGFYTPMDIAPGEYPRKEQPEEDELDKILRELCLVCPSDGSTHVDRQEDLTVDTNRAKAAIRAWRDTHSKKQELRARVYELRMTASSWNDSESTEAFADEMNDRITELEAELTALEGKKDTKE